VSLAQRPGPHGPVSPETTPSQLLGMIVTSDNRCMEANERPDPKALDGVICEQVRRQLQLLFFAALCRTQCRNGFLEGMELNEQGMRRHNLTT